jgi:RimJ/RimL family protein N-acetyltransferase
VAHAGRVLRLQRIAAITSPENLASIAVLERIGLKFERMIRLRKDGDEWLKLFGITLQLDSL